MHCSKLLWIKSSAKCKDVKPQQDKLILLLAIHSVSSSLCYSLLIVIDHPSYDQWDPCGEGELLQVPRCKHLRGPDMDYTHSNSG